MPDRTSGAGCSAERRSMAGARDGHSPSIMSVTIAERDLFGGAIQVSAPANLVDASSVLLPASLSLS